jgi:pyrroline-5-carboxylate reductase
LINSQVVEGGPSSITCSDVYAPTLELAAAKGYNVTSDNAVVCQAAKSALLIAVKPHIVPKVCDDIAKSASGSEALIISVAAGVTLQTLQSLLPGRRVVRVMPNTPCAVGVSATGYTLGEHCTPEDRVTVELIFGSVGKAFELTDENLLNGVTGVSGSGPAYVFAFIEALADGGVRVGLPRATALQLAAQTVKGAAEMVLQGGTSSEGHPGVLKDRVCSPGGTTIAGVEQLEQGAFRATVIQAVEASTRRSLQLGGTSEDVITSKYNL